ncbi:hypothetical protein BJ165DRAFT_1409304 [Panaeolus papilionaceus]|nr:hypothetical protein BJ165DRAFT_1409304 [Panaeolus papilionaceus]
MSFKKNTLDRIPESDCYNKEAFRLYRDSTSSFANLAAQSAQLSSSDSVLFDTDDGHPKGNLKARQGVSSGSGSISVRSSSGRGMSMSATGGGNRSGNGQWNKHDRTWNWNWAGDSGAGLDVWEAGCGRAES